MPAKVTVFQTDASKNALLIETLFHHKMNEDFITHRAGMTYADGHTDYVYLLYMKGMADQKRLEDTVLFPVQNNVFKPYETSSEYIAMSVLRSARVKVSSHVEEIKAGILYGQVAVFFPHEEKCVLVDVPIEQITMPDEKRFQENLDANLSFIRRNLVTERLCTEYHTFTKINYVRIALLYVKGVTKESTLETVKTSLAQYYHAPSNLSVSDYLYSSHLIAVTEKPDHSCSLLLAGYVILLVDQQPFAYVCPTTVSDLFGIQSGVRDSSSPKTYLTRITNYFFLFLTLLLPGLYVSITNYHPELIPVHYLLSLSGSKLNPCYPTMIILLLFETAVVMIQLISRYLSRKSEVLSTIGSILALSLIFVELGAISTIPLFFVLITKAGTFLVPSRKAMYWVSIGRITFLFLGGTLGFFGVAFGVIYFISHLMSLHSFGVPFLSFTFPIKQGYAEKIKRGNST